MSKKQDIIPRNDKGDLHGLVIFYYADGKIDNIKRYVGGIVHGIQEEYRSNGELWWKSYYNGRFVYDEWYGIGKRKRIKFDI